MHSNTNTRQLTFEDIKDVLNDTLQVLVEEGRTLHICNRNHDKVEVLEQVFVSDEVHMLLRHLCKYKIIYKGKCKNIVSDIPDFATFYDIYRSYEYGTQPREALELAKSLGVANEN